MSMEADIQAKMLLMSQGFLSRLPARLEKMDQAFTLCKNDVTNGEHWLELHRLLHSLGGTAGTFGYCELGLEARRIEASIKLRLLENDWTLEDIDGIAAALKGLQDR